MKQKGHGQTSEQEEAHGASEGIASRSVAPALRRHQRDGELALEPDHEPGRRRGAHGERLPFGRRHRSWMPTRQEGRTLESPGRRRQGHPDVHRPDDLPRLVEQRTSVRDRQELESWRTVMGKAADQVQAAGWRQDPHPRHGRRGLGLREQLRLQAQPAIRVPSRFYASEEPARPHRQAARRPAELSLDHS